MSKLLNRRVTRRELVTQDFHGTIVADPYFWLNDDTSPEVREWMDAQNSDFSNYIGSFPVRDEFKNYLTKIWNYERSGVPKKVEDFYYTWRNNGLQNQSVLYRSKDPSEKGKMVFDPNTLSEDGTVAVTTTMFSPKGRYLAYGLSSKGSDWQTMYVLDLETLKNLTDKISHIRFTTACWLKDESGFFYSCFPPQKSEVLEADAKNMMVKFHKLGCDQSEDKLIYQDEKNPEWNYNIFSDEDNKYVFKHVWYGTLSKNKLYFRLLDGFDSSWMPIADNFDESWEVVGVVNDIVYITTQQDAPLKKVMSVKLSENGISEWKTIIPEGKEMLEYVMIVNNQILCVTLNHAAHKLSVYGLDGKFVREIKLPTAGSIVGYFAKQKDKEMFIQFSSSLYPNTVLKYSFDTDTMTTVFAPKIDFNFDDYETVQEFVTSKDGTKVPIFITKHKNTKKDGNNPTCLYGYGGFEVSMTPVFAPSVLGWLNKGGMYVLACTRGGNEYGEAWHRAGMLESKQNVFDDFIAVAEYLISEKYTSKEKIGIQGGSNGGLLTGACLVQRPELFGAVSVEIPVLDMLNYHRYTIGRYWIGEYGNADDPEHFPFLYAYSPLHNVKMNTVYPPTLISTADTDDRVVPLQARKFAATLQAADAGDNPIYIRIEKSAGHGAGKPISKIIDERADLWAFMYVNLND